MATVRLKNRKGTRNIELEKRRSAQIWLIIALVWPLLFLKVKMTGIPTKSVIVAKQQKFRSRVRAEVNSLLSKWENIGYGPLRPRVAVIVVGDEVESVVESVKSVYQYTDRNRIICVIVIMDGMEQNEEIVTRLASIDEGMTEHSHGGGISHFHRLLDKAHGHGKKLEVFFNRERLGIAECRSDGAEYVRILSKKYEDNGMKKAEEEIMLVMLRPDAVLTSFEWVNAITAALIVPDKKIANAVSFAVDYGEFDRSTLSEPGLAAAFDISFNPYWTRMTSDNTDASMSFASPMLSGGATAMRLNTFLNLPSLDKGLTTYIAADIELSLNLWLCADGIDVVSYARVSVDPSKLNPQYALVTDKLAARLAAAWMPTELIEAVQHARSREVTVETWDKLIRKARNSGGFLSDLQKKCRPFSWYIKNINPDLRTSLPKRSKNNIIKLKTNVHEEASQVQKPVQVQNPLAKPVSARKDQGRILTPAKLEILSHAEPISLIYEQLSVGEKHPHMGARDASGKLGYIHDATALRKNAPSFEHNSMYCDNNDGNYKMLTQKVVIDFDAVKNIEKPVKIFCVVYTIQPSHDRIPPILQTWGQKCDGFMVASNKTDPALYTVEIPHEGEEIYNNIWQKVRSIWSYVYDNYYQDYDFFHIGGDDLFLIIENLRLYLSSIEIQTAAQGGKIGSLPSNHEKPLFLGRRFAEQGNHARIFNSGGSGYTLNKAALKALVVESFPTCFPHMKTFAEDVMVAACLRKLGVFPFETRDEKGGERYMPFAPAHHLSYNPPKQNPDKDWYVKYAVDKLRLGLDHCSSQSVAFHYIKGYLMKRMYAILYGFCKA